MKLDTLLEAAEDDPFEPISMKDTEVRYNAAKRELRAIYARENYIQSFVRNHTFRGTGSDKAGPIDIINWKPDGPSVAVRRVMGLRNERLEGIAGVSYIKRIPGNEAFIAKVQKYVQTVYEDDLRHNEVKARAERLRKRLEKKTGRIIVREFF